MKRFVLAASMLLFACTSFVDPVCACSPAGGGTAVITGTVTSPDATPVQDATVKLRIASDVTCEEPVTSITTEARTGPAGRFRHSQSWTGGRKCFRMWAEPPPGTAWTSSESQHVRIDYLDRVTPDSVELVFRLR